MAPLLIADVPWLLYRSYFALPRSIVGASGQPVNALLGTVNALLSAAEQHSPRAVAACFGSEQAAYRVELYPPYHAHREPMPAQLGAQWGEAEALLRSFGWSVVDAGDLEADDAIGSLAQLERTAGGQALLLTGDRDLYQALDASTRAIEMRKGGGFTLIGPDQVRERLGVRPALVPDLIALRGDPSDGLPGARGVGAKTAASLLAEHRSLEGVLAAAAKNGASMSVRVASALREQAELLRTFKRIATLQPVDVRRPSDQRTDVERGAEAAARLGMRQLASRLRGGAAS